MSILYNYICPKNMQVSELQARVEQSRKPDGDMVEISGVGAPVFAETSEMPPVVYNSAGETTPQEAPAQAEISVVV